MPVDYGQSVRTSGAGTYEMREVGLSMCVDYRYVLRTVFHIVHELGEIRGGEGAGREAGSG